MKSPLFRANAKEVHIESEKSIVPKANSMKIKVGWNSGLGTHNSIGKSIDPQTEVKICMQMRIGPWLLPLRCERIECLRITANNSY